MTRYLGRKEILDTNSNEFNSAAIFPVWHELPMLRRGQINVAGIRRRRKLENSSVWKDRIIVASTCRRSVQFGFYITWLWMVNDVSVIIKMLPSPSLGMGASLENVTMCVRIMYDMTVNMQLAVVYVRHDS